MSLPPLLSRKVPSCAAVGSLIVALAIGWSAGALPVVVVKAYLCASILSYFAYRIGEGNRQRVSGCALLAFDLAGGWPGGAVAHWSLQGGQHVRIFRVNFWAIAALNGAALGAYWNALR